MATLCDVYVVLRKIHRQVKEMRKSGKINKDILRQLNKRGEKIIKLIPQEFGISDEACQDLPGAIEIGPRSEEELCALKQLFHIR